MKAIRAFRVVVPYAITFFALVLASCAPPTTPPQEEPPHYLTISNNSSYDLCFVRWTDAEGREYSFSPDQVYDSSLEIYVGGMLSGSDCRLPVSVGNSSIRFFFSDRGREYSSVDAVIVLENSEEIFFSITDGTKVI